jgi:hypothetical protein
MEKNEKEKNAYLCLMLLKIKCQRRSMFQLEHLHRARMGEIPSKRTSQKQIIALGNGEE